MKIRNLTRLGALAVSLTMVTTSLMGGTLAKYTTTVSGTDTVTLARFGYEANDDIDGVEYTTGSAATVDLFNDLTTDATGTIQSTTESMYFAPGAYGTFQIEMDGTNSDVDIEMAGSTVIATATGAADTTDMFISYTISYTQGESEFDVDDTNKSGTAVTGTNMYNVHRVDMDQFAYDLQTVLDAVVLEKNSMGTITVEYAWEDLTGTVYEGNSFDFHNADPLDDTEYDKADTELGIKWTGANNDNYDTSIEAPTFTLTINNVASQVMTADPSYTQSTDINYRVIANFNNAASVDFYAYTGGTVGSNYSVINSGTADATITPDDPTEYVSFDMNGVAVTSDAIEDAEVGTNFAVTLPEDPESNTHVFVGWSTNENATTGKTASDIYSYVGDSRTLYAIWEEIEVTLNTNVGNATGIQNITGMPTDTVLTLNADGTVTLPVLDSTNYIFDGWYTGKVNGVKVESGEKVFKATDTLYAQWTLRDISAE